MVFFWSYKRTFIYTSIVAAILSISINLGLFDRPDFIYYDSLWSNSESKKDDKSRPMYAVLATMRTKNIGGNIGWLIETTKSSLLKDDSDGKASTLMSEAAAAYGAPDGAEELSVGLYFDDPKTADEPRWGIGWALAVKNFKDLEVWKHKVAKEFEEKHKHDPKADSKVEIRAVRIGPGPVLKAKISWRNWFTPMIQPMLQWKRGFQTFEDGQKQGLYDANNNRHIDGDCDALALEVYVTGPHDSMEFIDYVLLLGDTSTVWDDTFPIPHPFTDEDVKIE